MKEKDELECAIRGLKKRVKTQRRRECVEVEKDFILKMGCGIGCVVRNENRVYEGFDGRV